MATKPRVVKADGSALTEAEKEVERCIADIEASSQTELRAEVRDLVISSVKAVEVPAVRKTALVIYVPYRVYTNIVKRIHARLVQELEKKLKKHVIVVAQVSRLIVQIFFISPSVRISCQWLFLYP